MTRLVAIALALCLPVQATALSCMAPSVERSYAQFSAAEEAYIIVHGRITFDPSDMPQALSSSRHPPELTVLPAHLMGKSLGQKGFRLPFDQNIFLEVSCLGPWCGSMLNGEDILAFVKKTESGYTLAVTPCGGSAFGAPKPAMLKKVTACARNGACNVP